MAHCLKLSPSIIVFAKHQHKYLVVMLQGGIQWSSFRYLNIKSVPLDFRIQQDQKLNTFLKRRCWQLFAEFLFGIIQYSLLVCFLRCEKSEFDQFAKHNQTLIFPLHVTVVPKFSVPPHFRCVNTENSDRGHKVWVSCLFHVKMTNS